MPASPYDPIGSALKGSFSKGGGGDSSRSSMDSRMEANLQRSLLTTVAFDDPIRLVPSGLKPTYILLNPKTEAGPGGDNGNNNKDQPEASNTSTPGIQQLDQVPPARITLYRREQIDIGVLKTGGPGAGMINMGNTCYLNSTLQALFHIPALVNYLRSGGHEAECSLTGYGSCTICLLAGTLKQSQNSHTMKPSKIYDKLKMICKHLVHGRQEDAHEFLRYLVESLQKCYLLSKQVPKNLDVYSKETTPFNQIFGGYMRQELRCMKCQHISTTFQHFMEVLLDIRNADNIESAVGGYFKKEILGHEDMYKCENCKQKVQASKVYRIERPPLVLCIQLKRFNMMGGKNGRPVALSRILDITNFVRWSHQTRVSLKYRLVSLINHVGPSPNCGHYTAIGEAPSGTFFRFDDANVSPAPLQNVLATSAYVLFYEITKQSRDELLARPARKSSAENLVGPQLPSTYSRPGTPVVPPAAAAAAASRPPPSPLQPAAQHGNLPRLIQEPVKTGPRPLPLMVKPAAVGPFQSAVTNSSPLSILPNKLGVLPKVATSQPSLSLVKGGGGLVPYGEGDSSSDTEESTPSTSLTSQRSALPPSPALSKPVIQFGPGKTTFLPRAIQVQLIKAKEAESTKATKTAEAQKETTSPTAQSTSYPSGASNGASSYSTSSSSHANNGSSSNNVSNGASKSADNNVEAASGGQLPRSASLVREQNGDLLVGTGRTRTNSESERQRLLMDRLGITVSDKDSHNPSIHSDNSTGSTHSFTVTELRGTAPSPSLSLGTTSHKSWKVSSTLSKRERSVPQPSPSRPQDADREEPHSDTEILASPRKRQKCFKEEPRPKKSLLDEMKSKTSETFREIGKDVMTATAKLKHQLGFRSNKVTDKLEKLGRGVEEVLVGAREEASTSCQPSTSSTSSTSSLPSTKLAKEPAEESDGADDESEEKEGKKKKHKKKKKKHKNRSRRDSRSEEEWEEKTKMSLDKYRRNTSPSPPPVRKSSANSTIPVHKWDSKPDLKLLGRSTTWDGSKGSDLAAEIRKGSAIRSWSGDVSSLEQTQEVRKRSAESDDEMDKGRTKKVKKYKEDRHWDHNPFQAAQDARNRGGQSANYVPVNRKSSGDSHQRSFSFDRGHQQERSFGNDHDRHDKHRFNSSFRHDDRHRDKHRNRDHNYHRERPGGDDNRWDYKRKAY